MQLHSIYLYPNKVEVFTNVSDIWVKERYRKVYNRNVKIYRGVDNRIDIQVKNSSQRSVSVANSYLVFNLVEVGTQRLILSKDCVLIDDDTEKNLKGRAYVDLSDRELTDLESGRYQFSISIEERTYDNQDYTVTKRTVTYTDDQYGGYNIIEILDDIRGEPRQSLEITEFSYTNPQTLGENDPKFYISSIIQSDIQTRGSTDYLTFQFYFTEDYDGTVSIEGSLDKSNDPKNWVTIEEFVPDDLNTYENVYGKWNWYRVKYTPLSGNIDKIVIR
jgi:hypothetical protein